MLETGDFGGDKLSGLEFAGFSRQNTDFGALQTPGAGFRRKTSEFGGPGALLTPDTKKTHFSEFSVFSAFCTKNGAVTLTGDIGKTFSGLKNLAVLQGFATKNPTELGYYRLTFLTTKACTAALLLRPRGPLQPALRRPRCADDP